MRILDPFQMNDWGIRRYLVVVILLQVGLWGSLAWDALGIDLPLVRQLSGLLSVILLPGVGILRVLRLHNLGRIESFLYSIALSIAIAMILGFTINTVYPPFGISRPLSSSSLMSTYSILIVILSALDYLRNVDGFAFTSESLELADILSRPTLVLLMILVTAIAGTVLMNHQNNNALVMLSLIGVSGVFFSIGFRNTIRDRTMPLVIAFMSLTLLLITSLIFNYVWGSDIQFESYFASSVLANGRWGSTTYDPANGMLSIVILAPTLSEICGIDLTWVFKIVYPLIFSLVPLGLFRLFQRQIATRISALSVLFFISLWGFFTESVALGKQEIAMFFLVVLLLVFFDSKLGRFERKALLLVIAFSLIVSHYGVSYLFLLSLFVVWLFCRAHSLRNPRKGPPSITLGFVLYFFTVSIMWYTFTASSYSFDTILRVMERIGGAIYTDYFSTSSSQGLVFITYPSASILHFVAKLLHLASQMLITIGLFVSFTQKDRFKLKREFVVFAAVSYSMMIAGIVIPFFASALNTTRLYQIGVIFLAPFCIIGGIVVVETLSAIFAGAFTRKFDSHPASVLSVFLALFLLFNTGVVFELVGDHPASISLNPRTDTPGFNDQEEIAASWLFTSKGDIPVTADLYRLLIFASRNPYDIRTILRNGSESQPDSFLFLGTQNLVRQEVLVPPEGVTMDPLYLDLNSFVANRSRIYTNGGSMVYDRNY